MALPSFERAIFIARALPSSERRNLPRQRSESLKNFLVPCRFISTRFFSSILPGKSFAANDMFGFDLFRPGKAGLRKSINSKQKH
ncbi:uncharacterized protein LOC131254022 isoform X3 [Magnolia sinica]|uniref:uncharacterized protein LOC131254022 isoform X3 n=1 Tax=Magnolia sinica TaxID=86752 RepID=UPI002658293D|nr:uncharacterized protein LOC131254022 isoform X3 [Magnolia sinica]